MNAEALFKKARLQVMQSAVGIDSLPEPELLKRLDELWLKGFEACNDEVSPMLISVMQDMARIMVAHMASDAVGLKAVLDEIAKNHVKVVVPPDPSHMH